MMRFLWARLDGWTVLRLALVGGYAVLLSVLSVLKRASFTAFDADLAINDQLVWNAAHGRPFLSTLIEHADISLGDHFSFIPLYHAPLYWVWSDARALLIAQAVAIASAAIPLGWLADRRLGHRGLSTAVVAAFVLHPGLHTLNLFEFHLIPYSIPALAWLLWAIETRRTRLALLFALLALTVKEEMAIVGVAVGLYTALAAGQRRLGVALTLLCAAWGAATMGVVMPALSNAGGDFYYLRRYSQYGDSATSIALGLLARPWVLVADLFGPGRPLYYWQMLAPFAGLPLLAPTLFAVAVPTFSYLVLGNSPGQYSILFHYQAPLLPILAAATAAGLARLRHWHAPPAVLGAGLLGVALCAFWLGSPLPPAPGFDPTRYAETEHARVLNRFIAQVPSGTPVSAGRNLISRLSQRERVYNFPKIGDAETVLVDYRGQVYPGFYEDDDFGLRTFLRNPDFSLVGAEDGVWLFRKGPAEPPGPATRSSALFGGAYRLLGYDIGPRATASSPRALRLTLWWRAEQAPDERYTLFLHLLDQQGRRVWQEDGEPFLALLPTSEWQAGRVYPDAWYLDLDGLPAGEYRFMLGMYEFGGGDRLPVTGLANPPFPDAILLEPFVLR